MRALLQRVTRAAVRVDGETVGAISDGWAVLLGIGRADTDDHAVRLAERVVQLRGFDDEGGRPNRSLLDIGGAALVVSQVTLYAELARGRRPSFTEAASLDQAQRLVEVFVARLRALGVPVETGRFRAHMVVEIVNDGPVTFLLAEE